MMKIPQRITFLPLLLATMVGIGAGETRMVERSRSQVTIYNGEREMAVHHSGEGLDKNYIHPLWTPDGRIVTYDAPADHVHHRGLSVCWGDVSDTDFWAESYSPPGKRGRIATQRLEQKSLEDGRTILVEHNDWLRSDQSRILSSIHAWTFYPPKENLQIVDLDMTLTALEEKVVFGSDAGGPRPYHGLTLRIGPFENPRYFNAAGDEGGENCFGKSAKWCAVSGRQGGGPVTVAILDHPGNISHPTRFAVYHQGMQFISSSPNFSEPKTLKQNETWRLRYRVIAGGDPKTNAGWDLDALWREYAESTD